MTDGTSHTEDWAALPWKQYQRNVYRLQKRIYRAARQGDWKRVHRLQRLLLRSWSARCLAVRQVTQENRGKRTPGVDGVAALTPKQRLRLAGRLRRLTGWTVAPIRRTYIPKPNNPTEKRGLGIPVMADRALQALVKQALEPEWEAVFEANSYGFRPGRSAHDAIEAIFNAICLKPKFVLIHLPTHQSEGRQEPLRWGLGVLGYTLGKRPDETQTGDVVTEAAGRSLQPLWAALWGNRRDGGASSGWRPR